MHKILYIDNKIKITHNKIYEIMQNGVESLIQNTYKNVDYLYIRQDIYNSQPLNNANYKRAKLELNNRFEQFIISSTMFNIQDNFYTLKETYKKEEIKIESKLTNKIVQLGDNIKSFIAPNLIMSKVEFPKTNKKFELIEMGDGNTLLFWYYNKMPIIKANRYNLQLDFGLTQYENIEIPSNSDRLTIYDIPQCSHNIECIESYSELTIYNDKMNTHKTHINQLISNVIELYTNSKITYDIIDCGELNLHKQENLELKDLNLRGYLYIDGNAIGTNIKIDTLHYDALFTIHIINCNSNSVSIFIENIKSSYKQIHIDIKGKNIEIFYKGERQIKNNGKIIIKNKGKYEK